MRYIFILISVLLLSSCGSYQIQVRQPEISHVLAITKEGDTIQVPIEALQRNLTPDTFTGYRFYWNNSLWMYNDWYWNYWYNNPQWFHPRFQVRTPRNRVRVQTPRYTPQRQPNRVQVPRQPQRRTPQVQQNRGRSTQTPRTRTQTTPNVIRRSSPAPRSSSRRGNGNQ